MLVSCRVGGNHLRIIGHHPGDRVLYYPRRTQAHWLIDTITPGGRSMRRTATGCFGSSSEAVICYSHLLLRWTGLVRLAGHGGLSLSCLFTLGAGWSGCYLDRQAAACLNPGKAIAGKPVQERRDLQGRAYFYCPNVFAQRQFHNSPNGRYRIGQWVATCRLQAARVVAAHSTQCMTCACSAAGR